MKITNSMSDTKACAAGIANLVTAMKEKLFKKRRSGRIGWHDPGRTFTADLAGALVDHLAKGDLVDVANFSMMLYNRHDGGLALIGTWAKRIKEWQDNGAARRTLLPERKGGDITLRELQTQIPWTTHYHHDFRASPMAHKDFAHALLHVTKALGKLAAVVNDAEHGGSAFTPEEVDRFVADLVVCALRMANTCPGRTIDLQRAVVDRIESKNHAEIAGVKQ